MRICHVITTLVYGGAEKLLVNTANLHVKNHEVHVVYLKGEPLVSGQFANAVSVHKIPISLHCIFELRQLMMDIQPDIVHTHLGHADFIGLWTARNLPIRTFCTMHNIWFKWDWRDYLYFVGYRFLFNYIVSGCHIIGISKSVSDHVENRLGVAQNRITTLYNAVPDVTVSTPRAKLREELNIPEDAFVLLFVGRLHIQKSVDTLLLAAKQLAAEIANLQVLIVGEGKGYEEENLRSLCNEIDLNNAVRFCGTTETPEYYFSAADAFVLPSVFEGLGLVVLEAFRASIPVIATNIEGPQELIRHGENGLLFEPRNVEQLVESVLKLYHNTALRQRLGVTGNSDFQSRFSMQRYAESLEKLYLGNDVS